MIERNIDYIQCSASISETELKERGYLLSAGNRFYNRSYVDSFGIRYFFGNPNSKKCLMVASGSAMQEVRNYGMSDMEMVCSLLKLGANFSRLDLAVTKYIDDWFVTIEEIEQWVKDGVVSYRELKRGTKGIYSLSDEHEAERETLYIGDIKQRGKRGIFRAYDKGFEMNLERYMVTRLELEERKERAHSSAIRIAEGHALGSVFKSRFNVDDDKFQMLMDAPGISIQRGKSKEKIEHEEREKKRWEWLLSQVAPAIRDLIENSSDKGMTEDKIHLFLSKSGLLEDARKIRDYIVNLDNL